MKRRLIATLMAMAMVLGLLPGGAWAEDTFQASGICEDGLQWRFETTSSNNGQSIGTLNISGQGSMADYHDQSEPPWFQYLCSPNADIKVIIGEGVTRIGSGAFEECMGLTAVSLPNTIISIGSFAFEFCKSLTAIHIPSSVVSIEERAFFGTDLTSVSIPDSVTRLEESAFAECFDLVTVSLSESINSIAPLLFSSCYSLSSINIPNSITNIGGSAFSGCKALSELIIPNNITYIAGAAFHGCGLTTLRIPEGVTVISNDMLRGCANLTSVIIPSSVVKIEKNAFTFCESLADVYYSGSMADWKNVEIDYLYYYLDNIGYGNNNRSLREATIHYNSTGPNDVGTQSIDGILRSGDGWKIRWKCNYKEDADGNPSKGSVEINVNDTNTTEELYLYDDSGEAGFPWEREPYNIPKSTVETLAVRGRPTKKLRLTTNSFKGYSGLKTVIFDFVSGVDSYAFEGCSALEQVGFLNEGSGFTTIGDGAFRNCTNLTKMDFPGSLTGIGAEAFKNTGLGTITLGSNITEIGADAFAGCANLKIRGYEGSVAHQYAQSNSIPFEPIDTDRVTVPFGVDGKTISMNIAWSPSTSFAGNPTSYQHDLAIAGLVMSWAAEDGQSRMGEVFTKLGFSESTHRHFNYDFGAINPAVSFAAQNIVINGKQKTLVACVVRGTTDAGDVVADLLSMSDGFGGVGADTTALLRSYLTQYRQDNDVILFITGHSLGGAVTGIVTENMEKELSSGSVFAYAFAPPYNSGFFGFGEGNYTSAVQNIINTGDWVPTLPPTYASRIGRIGYVASTGAKIHQNPDSVVFTDSFKHSYENLSGKAPDAYREWNDHLPDTYMALLLANKPLLITTVYNYRLVKVLCPVDIEVLDTSGTVVGRTENDVVDNTIDSDNVYIFVQNGEKYIYLFDDDDYSFRMTGTDDGILNYSVEDVAADGSILSEKSYLNVALTPGKKLTSEVGGTTDTPDVRLLVLGDADQPEKEVLPDGNGTEVPITKPVDPGKPDDPAPTIYTITFDPNGGSVTPTSAKTVADGKLTALPIPICAGYSFQGWYTAISGGSVVTTDTVFAQNTTLYAHWSYNGSSGPNGGSSTDGDVTYPSGGNSSGSGVSTPSYSITAPSAPGGTVTISPKSAAMGTTITITVKPDAGYKLLSLTVINGNNKEIPLTDQGNGKYTFAMPGSKVTVNAAFQAVQPTAVPTPETPWSNPFTDVSEESWYYDAVKFVGENGLMNGIGNDMFAPDANLSRAMLAQILYNKEGKPNAAGINVFTDVAPGEWYSNAITWAAANNIVGGYGSGLFGPNDNITREQLAVMLWRYAGEPAAASKELHFSDAKEVSNYAISAINWAVENSIVNGEGDNILDPKGFATRAQVAQMLKNYLENKI